MKTKPSRKEQLQKRWELDEKRLFEILGELGLTKREADMYIFLTKRGPQKAHAVATHLKIDGAQTYRSLTSLQEKGIIESTIESPARYLAVPIEPLIETYVKSKKTEITRIETEKNELVDYFKSISTRDTEYPMAKFQVVTGRNAIYARISRMVEQAKTEILGLTTSLGLIQEDTAGILDTIIETAKTKKDVQFKMLVTVTNENVNIMKSLVKKLPTRNPNIEWRHTDLASKVNPRLIIRDDEETTLYMMPQDETSESTQQDSGLSIHSRIFVSTLRTSFFEMWRSAINIKERINELEKGTPREETTIIKDPTDSQTKINTVLDSTKKEIVVISSAAGINKMSRNNPFKPYMEKGVKLRIMAPIDLDNYEEAQKLAKQYMIKHVPISYLTMMIADNKHLFMFKTTPLGEEEDTYPFYLRNTFYTNDQKYVERTGELLNDIWKRGTNITETASESLTGTPIIQVPSTATLTEIAETMLDNSATSVLVTENKTVIGIINQKDILGKILKPSADPTKITAKKVMSTPTMTIESTEPLIAALRTMKEKHIPRLAVMKEGKLVALLT